MQKNKELNKIKNKNKNVKNTLADNLTCVLVVRLNFAALIESIGILSDRKGA